MSIDLAAGPLAPTRSFVWADKPGDFAFEGLFPDGMEKFFWASGVVYPADFGRPNESLSATSVKGAKITLRFLEK